ncbi:MAG: CBS domain-containing protein [Acidobacteriota bacterium]|nr:CBS domain-containing protein [Acidobacteriota bacterium]
MASTPHTESRNPAAPPSRESTRLSVRSWRTTRARDVMRPVDPTLFIESTATMARADQIMQHNGVGALAVIDQRGQLVGFLQRGRLKKVKVKR